MDPNLDGTFEDALVSSKGNLMDIDVHLIGDDLRDIAQHTLSVDAIDLDGSIEEELLVHIPLGIKDTRTKTCLEFAGHRTGTLVDLDAIFAVDESQDVVAGYWMTTVGEDIHADGLFRDDARLLLVEVFSDDQQLRCVVVLLLLSFV